MKPKLERIFGKRLGDMELAEINLIILLTMIIVENIIILSLALFFRNTQGLMLPMMILILGCGLLLLLDLYCGKHDLIAILAIIILNGIAVPMILKSGHVVYGIVIIWFVAGMLIIYSVFKGMVFLLAMIAFIFEYCYLYSGILLPGN